MVLNIPFPILIAGALFSIVLLYNLSRPKSRLPPGPRGLPLIGNVHQIPQDGAWITFADWAKKYGDLMYVNLIGQPVVIVNSRKIANELMDKRSSIYSDRPNLVMADLAGYGSSLVLKPYGEDWRKQRRLISQDLAQNNVGKYFALQERETRRMVRDIVQDSDSFVRKVEYAIGAIIVRVTYGYNIESDQDPFLAGPLQAMVNFSKATTPGRWLVDIFPSLRYLPRWMPGSEFLNSAEEWRKILMDTCWIPYNWCKENLNTGKTLMPNLVGQVLQKHDGKMSDEDRDTLVYAASGIFGAGLDTNQSQSLTFYMCMILNPEVQKKAQAELDTIVGSDRLPTIDDRADLPYVRSIMAEVLRYAPSVPLCIPHSLTQDDIYEDYFLPKGTLIMPNLWSMLHDPKFYPDPMAFKPERYNLDDAEMEKTKSLAFGFGRRVCPGRHFAEATLFSVIATTLATCDILPGLDDKGNEVLPKVAYTPGTITFPEAYKLRLKPRSTQAAKLLAEVSDEIALIE